VCVCGSNKAALKSWVTCKKVETTLEWPARSMPAHCAGHTSLHTTCTIAQPFLIRKASGFGIVCHGAFSKKD